MTPFIYDQGAYRAKWDAIDLAAFQQIAQTIISVLDGDADNPIRQRLLPPISQDTKVAEEFQRLAGQQLVDSKVRILTEFADLLANTLSNVDSITEIVDLVLPESRAKSFLQALTAIRVGLAERLEIEDDADSDLLYHQIMAAADGSANVEEPPDLLGIIFVTSGWLQDSLVSAMQGQMAPDAAT